MAAPLFTDIAQALASDAVPFDDLVPVQQEGLNITRETVCTATGDLDVSLCGDTTETWYIPGRSPTRSSGVFRTILIDAETGCAPAALFPDAPRSAYGNSGLLICRRCSCGRVW